jgi:replicative DNA helicase
VSQPDGLAPWWEVGITEPRLLTMRDMATEYERDLLSGEGTAIPTGYREIDTRVRGGFRPGEVVYLPGYTGNGKSWLLGSLGHNIMLGRPDIGALHLSLEMPAGQWFERLCGMHVDMPGEWVETQTMGGKLAEVADDLMDKAEGRLLTCVDPIDLRQLLRVTERAKEQLAVPLKVVLIDYAGCIAGVGRTSYEQGKTVAFALKKLAKMLNVVVICALQVTGSEGPHDPITLNQVRDAKDFAHQADFVIGVYAPGKKPDITPSEASVIATQYGVSTYEIANIFCCSLLKVRNAPTQGQIVTLYFRQGSRKLESRDVFDAAEAATSSEPSEPVRPSLSVDTPAQGDLLAAGDETDASFDWGDDLPVPGAGEEVTWADTQAATLALQKRTGTVDHTLEDAVGEARRIQDAADPEPIAPPEF